MGRLRPGRPADHDAGVDTYLAFEEDLHVQLTYQRGAGWSQQATVLHSEMAPGLVPHGADVTVRAGLKLALEATAKAKLPGSDGADAPQENAPLEDETAQKAPEEQEGGDGEITLPEMPVSESVQCAANWAANGASLELGVELSAALLFFVEGSYPLFSDTDDVAFDIDAGAEFDHAEALSIPGLCVIGCESLAGEGSANCETQELFRLDVASI